MERKIEEKIDLYCEIYQGAYEKASKTNPDNARHMASEIFGQVARDLRSELISQLRRGENEIEEDNWKENQRGKNKNENNEKPATKKQRQALHKFGIENTPDDLTKKEASEILNKLISLSKEGNSEAINQIVEDLNADHDWGL